MKQQVRAVTTATPITNGIFTSLAPVATGKITLNGSFVTNGIATLPHPGRIEISSTATETATFIVTGTNPAGNLQQESIAGSASSPFVSALDYVTVTSITIVGNSVGTLTGGSSAVGSTSWVPLDYYSTGSVAVQIIATGGVNWTSQYTVDNLLILPSSGLIGAYNVFNNSDTNAVNSTAAAYTTNFLIRVGGVRTTINSGAGTVTMTVLDLGPLST